MLLLMRITHPRIVCLCVPFGQLDLMIEGPRSVALEVYLQ